MNCVIERAIPVAFGACLVLAAAGCPAILGGGTIGAKEESAHSLVNFERASRGLNALVMREDLRLVARGHSEDMVARDFFAHVNPDGEDPFDRMGNAGVTYNTAGENIAWNNFPNPTATAVEGWMNSAGHRANILRESFTHAGMGVASDGAGGFYYTQVFVGISKDVAHGVVEIYYDKPLAMAFD